MKTPLALAAALSIAVPAGAASAGGSYTGTWRVKLTHDVHPTTQGYVGHGPNTTHCIVMTDDGSVGWPHSGYVLVDKEDYGQFAVINNTILIYVDVTGSGEEPASLSFSASARDGKIAEKGLYDIIQGGTSYDAADATFTRVSSC